MNEFVVLAIVMILALGAYWSLVIFPRQREFQKQQKYVGALREGDEMITFGGIIGTVQRLDVEAGIAYLEIADGVTIRVVTASLMRPYKPEELAQNVQMAGVVGSSTTDVTPQAK
jgi:preprotein translocase subunit YajC